MKVYVVMSYADGENYEGNLPEVEGVFDTLKKAREFFKELQEDFIEEEDEYEVDEDKDYFEITDFDQDYHAIIRIVEKEVK